MNRIKMFTRQDLIRLGFIIPDPSQADLFLETINSEYIWRINRLLAEMLTPREIKNLSSQNDSDIRGFIIANNPECIDRIRSIKLELEEEIMQKRKTILTEKGGTFNFHEDNDDMT